MSRRCLAMLALVLGGVGASPAGAVTATYRCDDRGFIEVDGTPSTVTVRRGKSEWRFRRAGRNPRFVDRASGGTVDIKTPFLDLQMPGLSLWCRKVPGGMNPDDVYVSPRPAD